MVLRGVSLLARFRVVVKNEFTPIAVAIAAKFREARAAQRGVGAGTGLALVREQRLRCGAAKAARRIGVSRV